MVTIRFRNRVGWVFVAGLATAVALAVGNHLAGLHWPRSTAASETVFENGDVVVTVDRVIDGLAVRAVRDSLLYGVEDRFIHRSEDWGESWERVGRLGRAEDGLLVRARDLVLRRPLVRLLRRPTGPENLAVLPSGTVIVVYADIHRLPRGADTTRVLNLPVEDFAPPMPQGLAADGEGRVYVAEYRTGDRPQSARILRGTRDGTVWELCHRFKPGEVFHIHTVRYDPYDDRVLVTTGDRDEESGIYELDQDCEGVTRVGGGSQDWRVVAPVATDTALVWGSDNTLTPEGPGIFVKGRESGSPTRVEDLPKPSYHSGRLADGTVVISATATPPHPRVPGSADSTSLWLSRDLERWHRVYALAAEPERREWGPTRAQLSLPTGTQTPPYVFASPWYTAEGSPRTLRMTVEWRSVP